MITAIPHISCSKFLLSHRWFKDDPSVAKVTFLLAHFGHYGGLWYLGSLCLQHSSRWRHQMETLSALLALSERNPPVCSGFPSQRPVMWSFDVLFDLCLNKRLRKQSRRWWFEMQSRSLWRRGNVVFTMQNNPVFVLYDEGCKLPATFRWYEITKVYYILCFVNIFQQVNTVQIAFNMSMWFSRLHKYSGASFTDKD